MIKGSRTLMRPYLLFLFWIWPLSHLRIFKGSAHHKTLLWHKLLSFFETFIILRLLRKSVAIQRSDLVNFLFANHFPTIIIKFDNNSITKRKLMYIIWFTAQTKWRHHKLLPRFTDLQTPKKVPIFNFSKNVTDCTQ